MTTHHTGFVAALCVMLAAGCGTVEQLDRFKDLDASGNQAAIAAEKVACTAGDSGCDQLHLIHGMACYHQGRAGVDAAARYECAIGDLQRGLQLSAGRLDDGAAKPYRQALLGAIRGRQDESQNDRESQPYTDALETASADFRDRYPDAQDGYFFGAVAHQAHANRLIFGQDDSVSGCAQLQQATDLLARGASLPGDLGPQIKARAREVVALHSRECRS